MVQCDRSGGQAFLLKDAAVFDDINRLSFVAFNILYSSSVGPESFNAGKYCFL